MKASLEVLLDVQKSYTQQLKKLTRSSHLTIAEWQLVNNIINGQDTQAELVAATQLDVSTLSRQLSKLVDKKMLTIEKLSGKPTTRKKYLYHITSAGQTALNEINTAFKQMETELFSQWTNEEQNLLKILLNRLKTSFSRLEN